MQYLLQLSAAAVLLLSSNAMFALGINYLGSGGNPLEKIHPALLVAIAAACLYPVARTPDLGSLKVSGLKTASLFMLAASLWVLLWSALSPNASGSELTMPIVTFTLPSLLLLTFAKATDRTLLIIARCAMLFMVANSLFGILGSVTGFSILPQTAGNSVIRDPRPTALLGHPLINAQMTGAVFLFLILTGLRTRFSFRSFLSIAVHGVALLAFGGRSALLIAVSLAILFSLITALVGAVRGNGRYFLNLSLITFSCALVIPIGLQLGFGDVLFERISNDEGSTDTRFAALNLVGRLDFEQFLIGAGKATRETLLITLGTPNGVESFPLALIVNYGFPTAALITAATFFALFKLARTMQGFGSWIVVYFFVTSATSLSIGSKTTSIALFTILLISFRTVYLNQMQRKFNLGLDESLRKRDLSFA